MSNVIHALDSIGRDAALRHVGAEVIDATLLVAGIAPEIRAAVLQGERARLAELLGANTALCCMVFPAKKDDDGEGEDEPAKKDDDEVSLSSARPQPAFLAG